MDKSCQAAEVPCNERFQSPLSQIGLHRLPLKPHTYTCNRSFLWTCPVCQKKLIARRIGEEKKQTRASAYLNFNINCGGAAGAWRGHRETSLHADITCLQEVCMCEKERAWFKRHCNMKTYACHGILGCSVPAEINGTGQGERPTGKLGRSVVQICPHSPEVVAPRATQSMPRGFESTSMVKPQSLRVARFIGGRSIVASIIARDMGEQRLPKSNKCHARFAQCSSSSLKKCDAVGFLRVSGVTFPVVSTPHISDTTPSCFSFRGKRFQPET